MKSRLPARVVFACALLFIPALANAAVDETKLIVRLAPQAGETSRNWATAKTASPALADALAAYNVSEVRAVFPGNSPLRLLAHAKHARLADFGVIRVPDAKTARELYNTLKSLPEIESVEYAAVANIAGAQITPNDPYFSTHQYPLRNTGAQPPYDPGTAGADAEMEAAWNITTGDSTTIIAIIDTGVDINHPEFAGRIWQNFNEEIDGFDNDDNGYVDDVFGYDFANGDGVPLDDHKHGTHCAGIAAASGNNGVGIAGMNWNCQIMAVKVLDAGGSGTFDAIAAGIVYAVDMGADVINLSLGGPSNQSALEAAVNYAIAAGVIVCAATGNDNSGNLFYPAALDSVVAVGATNSRDERAIGDLCPFDVDGSNFGPWIDVCAAGDVVWSTFPAAFGSYGEYCLTSMASPHVAGLATLVLALRPSYGIDSVTHYIRHGAEDQVGLPTEDTPGFDIYHGWGRINGRRTLQALAFEFPPSITAVGPQSVVEGDTLTFAVSAFDSNLTPPFITGDLPANSSVTDHGDGTATFTFVPSNTQAGQHHAIFLATDVDGNVDTAVVEITVIDGCACDCHGDPACDQVIADVLDVVNTINVAFRGAAALPDPNGSCPFETTDVNCSNSTDVLDVVRTVNVAFRGANPATEYCNACP